MDCRQNIVLLALSCTGVTGMAQTVGIGTQNPTATLHVDQLLEDSTLFATGFESGTFEGLTTFGEVNWMVTGEDLYEGNFSVVSGEVDDEQYATLQLVVEVPSDRTGYLSFMMTMESESGHDFLAFTDNGDTILHISGSHPWHERVQVLTAGIHILEWTYYKDDSGSEGEDAVWIDCMMITYIPNYTLRISDGTEATGKVLMSDPYGNASWQGLDYDHLFDKDNDTGIHAEPGPDADTLKYYTGGLLAWMMHQSNGNAILQPGNDNIFIGAGAGVNNTGSPNIAIGTDAAHLLTWGFQNIAVGDQAGYASNGSFNTFLGDHAGQSSTTALWNTMVGAYAGKDNLTGEYNVFVGGESGLYSGSGSRNVYVGYKAGLYNTDGDLNVCIGERAGYNATNNDYSVIIGGLAGEMGSGSLCTYLGYRAGQVNETNMSCFLGGWAGANNTSGILNTFVGTYSGVFNETGSGNTFLGNSSGYTNSSGNDNTFLGMQAGFINGNGDNNTFIGRDCGKSNTSASFNTFIGAFAAESNQTGAQNVIVGAFAGQDNLASNNTMLGYDAGRKTTTGGNNTFIGRSAGRTNTTGSENTFVGMNAGYSNTSGTQNTFMGFDAGNINASGSQNTFIGRNAGKWTNTGSENTFIGNQAGQQNTSGSQNTYLGEDAGALATTAHSNVVIGTDAGYNLTTAYESVYIGRSAGISTTDGEENVFIGHAAGQNNTIGSLNTVVGTGAMTGQASNTACVLIGNDASSAAGPRTNGIAVGFNASLGGSNEAIIGNSGMSFIGGYAGWTDLSDARVKEDIREQVPGLTFINALRPVSYRVDYHRVAEMIGEDADYDALGRKVHKSPPEFLVESREQKSQLRQSGFIAQEVAALVEKMHADFGGVRVPESEGQLYGLQYAEFTVPLVRAVQELSQQNVALQTENAELKSRMDALEAAITQLCMTTPIASR